MTKLLKSLPIPIAGLMLALAATGNLLSNYSSRLKLTLGSLSLIIFLLLFTKVLLNPKGTVSSFDNPVIASVSPTFPMGMMLMATYLKAYNVLIANIFWLIALAIHIILILCFTKKFILNFNINKVFPSYFIVYVGIVVASVSSPAFGYTNLGKMIFYFGFISYLILLPITLYRIIIIKKIPEAALPTITIFAAPASLCLAGYLSVFNAVNLPLVIFMATLSLISYVLVILYMPKMLRINFYPSYAAFTFPLVISAIAMKKTFVKLTSLAYNLEGLKYLVNFQELIALAIVIYVLIKFIINTKIE